MAVKPLEMLCSSDPHPIRDGVGFKIASLQPPIRPSLALSKQDTLFPFRLLLKSCPSVEDSPVVEQNTIAFLEGIGIGILGIVEDLGEFLQSWVKLLRCSHR
jgi:hypothetical protein